MTQYAVLLCAAWLALVAGCSSSEVDDTKAGENQAVLAVWKWRSGDTRRLIYEPGKMMLERSYEGGALMTDLIERPAERSDERKFDLDDGPRVEYLTLSEAGVVKYFSWEGRNFHTATASFVHPQAMTIGSNVQIKACVPTQLSDGATKALRLYKRLHRFKDEPEFAEKGFSAGGPYHAWLKSVGNLVGSLDREAMSEASYQLGIAIPNISVLGLTYMTVASNARRGLPANREDLDHIEDLERTLQAALALAFCRTEKGW